MTVNYNKLSVKKSCTASIDSLIVNTLDKADLNYKWCKVVEKTMERYYGEHKDKLIVKRFFENKQVNTVARELNIDRATYFRWKDEVFLTAKMWAQEYHLL